MTTDPYIGIAAKGRFEIERELGRGGVGVVYLAHDHELHEKPVVVKVLLDRPPESEWAEWVKTKFRHEVEALARIDHPGVVGVLDVGEMPDGKPFFVMPFVRGVNLRAACRHGDVDLVRAAEIVLQLGQALSAAHGLGVYHRDLKPENVMIEEIDDAELHVTIVDFGIAKVEHSTEPGRTRSGLVAGTVEYMAPEQLRAEPATAAVDVYALGVIAYELVAGRLPFEASSPAHLLLLQKEGVPVRPSVLCPSLPEESEAAILRGLAYEPERRHVSARELGVAFARPILGTGGSMISSHATHSSDAPTVPMPTLHAEVDVVQELAEVPLPHLTVAPSALEPVSGAVPLDSFFYVVRPADREFEAAIGRGDSVVLVKGARQVGKTSLLARGLQQARGTGDRVILTDLEDLSASAMRSCEAFYLQVAESIADQLDLHVLLKQVWNADISPNRNFERYIRREVLSAVPTHVVWGMDEADRLFGSGFESEVFGLFRSWHNKRSLDPEGPWRRLTLAIAYATEVHLLIANLNQSPFNIGTCLALHDFELEQVADLNGRYGTPLRTAAELDVFFALVGGNPYLVRRGLHEMVTRHLRLDAFRKAADGEEGPFEDHLRRVLVLVERDPEIRDAVRDVLAGRPCPSTECFYRLRSAGIIVGESEHEARPRCGLYRTYLERHLAS
jgi:serine/threonine protein kinase